MPEKYEYILCKHGVKIEFDGCDECNNADYYPEPEELGYVTP